MRAMGYTCYDGDATLERQRVRLETGRPVGRPV